MEDPNQNTPPLLPLSNAVKPKLSKRDKLLGYGCLLPLMVLGFFATLSHYAHDSRDLPQASVKDEKKGKDTAPKPFVYDDAKYIVLAAQKLRKEADELMADESWKPPVGFEFNPVKNWKIKAKSQHDEISSLYGYAPSAKNAGTVRHQVVEALTHMLKSMLYFEELAAATAEEGKNAARDLMRLEMSACDAFLRKAEHALENGTL